MLAVKIYLKRMSVLDISLYDVYILVEMTCDEVEQGRRGGFAPNDRKYDI